MTLKADYLKFVDKFVHEQDTGKAAMSSGFTAKYGKKLYAMPEVTGEPRPHLAHVTVVPRSGAEGACRDRQAPGSAQPGKSQADCAGAHIGVTY
jgi:hypothetical protein